MSSFDANQLIRGLSNPLVTAAKALGDVLSPVREVSRDVRGGINTANNTFDSIISVPKTLFNTFIGRPLNLIGDQFSGIQNSLGRTVNAAGKTITKISGGEGGLIDSIGSQLTWEKPGLFSTLTAPIMAPIKLASTVWDAISGGGSDSPTIASAGQSVAYDSKLTLPSNTSVIGHFGRFNTGNGDVIAGQIVDVGSNGSFYYRGSDGVLHFGLPQDFVEPIQLTDGGANHSSGVIQIINEDGSVEYIQNSPALNADQHAQEILARNPNAALMQRPDGLVEITNTDGTQGLASYNVTYDSNTSTSLGFTDYLGRAGSGVSKLFDGNFLSGLSDIGGGLGGALGSIVASPLSGISFLADQLNLTSFADTLSGWASGISSGFSSFFSGDWF